MAKGQSTSNVYGRRKGVLDNLSSAVGNAIGKPTESGPAATLELNGLLEMERLRLAQARSVLGCLRLALLHAQAPQLSGDPDFSATADVAIQLVAETIQHLDSATVKPLLDSAISHR